MKEIKNILICVVLLGALLYWGPSMLAKFNKESRLGAMPVPPDSGLITWLTGQRVLIEKGLIVDDYWTIETGEVTDFQKIGISESQGLYAVSVKFKCQGQSRGIFVEGNIRYHVQGTQCVFADFTPINVQKYGNW